MTRLGGSATASTWRLAAGGALVLGGIFTAALGTANVVSSAIRTAGVGSDQASTVGLAVGGLVVPTLISVIQTRLDTPHPYDRAILRGTVIAAVGVPVALSVAVVLPHPSILTLGAALPYVAGVLLAMWGVIGSAATGPARPTPSYHRSSDPTPDYRSAADGGEDDDLSFPLDDT